MPVMLIVAGPNGSGKSTFVNSPDGQKILQFLGLQHSDILNADVLAKAIAGEGQVDRDINLAAASQIDADVERAISRDNSFGVETVLSTEKYLGSAKRAIERGYLVFMLYVCVRTAELNYERVETRVKSGGHDVPREKILSRRKKSIYTLARFIPHVDELRVFDNSSQQGNAVLIARKSENEGHVDIIDSMAIPEITAVLEVFRHPKPGDFTK